MIEEVWRPVKNYEGLYEVSDLGRVRSLNYMMTGTVRVLVLSKDRYGYLYVGLSKDGFVKNRKVHRIVTDAFLSPDVNRPYIDHINGVKTDNRLCNLRRCSQSENMMNPHTRKKYKEYLEVHGTSMYSHPMSDEEKKKRSINYAGAGNPMYGRKHSDSAIEKMRYKARTRIPKNYKKVAQYTTHGEFIKIWDGVIFAARGTGINKSGIAGCCRNKTKTAGGYIWKYINKNDNRDDSTATKA